MLVEKWNLGSKSLEHSLLWTWQCTCCQWISGVHLKVKVHVTLQSFLLQLFVSLGYLEVMVKLCVLLYPVLVEFCNHILHECHQDLVHVRQTTFS